MAASVQIVHNIVDPFEDTESVSVSGVCSYFDFPSHNIVDPFEDTER